MSTFKYAVFGFEPKELTSDLRIMPLVCEEFRALPAAQDSLFQMTSTMDEAVSEIEQYKSKTCWSTYSAAVFNLNQFPSPEGLQFLIGAEVLGDPPCVFLVSLRAIQAPIYSVARLKVEQEAERAAGSGAFGSPSCIDTYTPGNRADAAKRVARIVSAYLEEEELRGKARQTGETIPQALAPASEIMRKSTTVFFGRRSSATSALFRRPVAGEVKAASDGSQRAEGEAKPGSGLLPRPPGG